MDATRRLFIENGVSYLKTAIFETDPNIKQKDLEVGEVPKKIKDAVFYLQVWQETGLLPEEEFEKEIKNWILEDKMA